ncbi:hypothetical protein LINGRAHAP2_LOCUS24294 [Linum grandiflorum]
MRSPPPHDSLALLKPSYSTRRPHLRIPRQAGLKSATFNRREHPTPPFSCLSTGGGWKYNHTASFFPFIRFVNSTTPDPSEPLLIFSTVSLRY